MALECYAAEDESRFTCPKSVLARDPAALAQEWRTRDSALGTTWAGLWQPTQQSDILAAVSQHAQRVDDVALKRLACLGVLPGVRDYSLLWALLPIEPVPAPEQGSFVVLSTQRDETLSNLDASATDQADTEDEDEAAAVVGVPIWNHGVLEQAKLSPVRHAIHLIRHLDDYHEPTVAALRRQCLRKLVGAPLEERLRASQAVAEAFLEQPTRWRDGVETAVHLSAVRECELRLGQRLKGSGRTKEQLLAKLESGLAALAMGGAAAAADQLYTQFRTRLERLESAKVVLMYEEQQYLQLTGIRDGRSYREGCIWSSATNITAEKTVQLDCGWSTAMRRTGLNRITSPMRYRRPMPPASSAAIFAYPTLTRCADMSKRS